ncbi:hypothetical protein [Paracoccus sp. pheM1]|uniref:hypothetical protein n=1 Tax=Paracoccus sp. pheM1 TaxID=2831675 RepID=UPI001BDB8E02|nr:hypothetical protein [Paracoccus sp. pheM1]MBT0780837.1 hypothetical protein [Paracoccus sp. pheM1]
MGTSASSKGSGTDQSLVPPWADDSPGEPLPDLEPKRFRAFRRAFGTYLKSGKQADLDKALGHYARSATGGRGVGPRRFGAVYTSGSDLYSVLSSIAGDGGLADTRGITKDQLAGQPIDVVCQRLTDALVPPNGDADKIRGAMNEAMIEVLGTADFDPDRLDEDAVQRILGEYLSQAVFQEIVEEVGGTWSQAAANATPGAESRLLETIRAIIEVTLGPQLDGRTNVPRAEIHSFMRKTLDDVWAIWEAHGD